MKLSVQYLMLNMQRQENPDPKQLANLAQTLLEQIDALTEIANSFSDFAQFSSANKGMEDLLQIIKAATNLYENDPNVHIQLICQESEIKVLLDKNQWIRLFNNLIKNSTQAVDTPTIAHISIKVWIQSGWINIDISDNGCGMSAELLPLIFEPKFTTKKSGAGLGLAIVKSIVSESGGSIGCSSQVGQGSTFSIQLPYNQV
jgi:signal transduction histidine kinase